MTTTKDAYNYWVKFAARLSVGVALALLVLKLIAWFDSNASVMLATATDSLLDLFASVVNLYILKIALAPPDKEHQFGHGKAESLGAMFQAAFITGSAILLMLTGLDRALNPVQLTQSSLAIGVTVTTVFATIGLVGFQQFVVKKTGSLAISADMLHYKSDLLLNIGVLVALILSEQLWPSADGIFTLLIGLYLLMSALVIAKGSLNQLMDTELPPEDRLDIETLINKHPQASGFHQLRTRQSGATIFVQFHLALSGDLSLKEAHAIGDKIEQEIKHRFTPCEVIIHHDPIMIEPTQD